MSQLTEAQVEHLEQHFEVFIWCVRHTHLIHCVQRDLIPEWISELRAVADHLDKRAEEMGLGR